MEINADIQTTPVVVHLTPDEAHLLAAAVGANVARFDDARNNATTPQDRDDLGELADRYRGILHKLNDALEGEGEVPA